MQDTTLVIIAVLAALAVLALWLFWRQQRRAALVQKYGPEYDRLVREKGDPKKAEKELEEREARVREFKLRPLDPAERDRHWSEWQRIQSVFVDRPQEATQEAQRLLVVVMRECGYPEADLDQRQRDLSVHYPDLVSSYREASEIAERGRTSSETTSTEDLRRAILSYRALFSALLEGDTGRRPSPKYEAAS